MTYLLTQVPAFGTVPQEKGPSVFQVVWERGLWGLGRCVSEEVVHRQGLHEGCVPMGLRTLLPASSAPETVKLIKAVEPQD